MARPPIMFSRGFKVRWEYFCLQGTVLDRIDYNIEQTATRVETGLQHLQKAEKYQKKNRKMFCIVILFVVLIVMIIILIAIKSW